ncbi:MAG TPA: HNH endonuclease [Gammaproteobacteria bacterium]|nr:HNH endonuclease [Gammaproteobacteria bacterium]
MSVNIQAAIGELELLRKLQRLLAEGDFVATYKFALLNALADLCLEREPAADGSLRVPVSVLAEKFIEYYWPQARPYRGADGSAYVLHQSTGRQAAVINTIVAAQNAHPTLSAARAAKLRWHTLVTRVAGTIVSMPLWKLQTVAGERDEFLYREAEFADESIRLLPGVPAAFRALYGLVLDAVRGAWLRQITSIAQNRPLLRDADLASFLFGSGRASLDGFRGVLRDHQDGRCLYCRKELRGAGCVDHFIAWSRYPVDLGHNLVLAHDNCNAGKRDFLAYPVHLERWQESHLDRASELAQRFDSLALPHDGDRSRAIAWWAYEQGEAAGAHAWIDDDRFVRLDGRWRDVLGPGSHAGAFRLVAEPPPPEYPT